MQGSGVGEEPAAGLPAEVDLRLWFEMTGCEGRHYFVEGNPHILGRVYAYCPVKQIVTPGVQVRDHGQVR